MMVNVTEWMHFFLTLLTAVAPSAALCWPFGCYYIQFLVILFSLGVVISYIMDLVVWIKLFDWLIDWYERDKCRNIGKYMNFNKKDRLF